MHCKHSDPTQLVPNSVRSHCRVHHTYGVHGIEAMVRGSCDGEQAQCEQKHKEKNASGDDHEKGSAKLKQTSDVKEKGHMDIIVQNSNVTNQERMQEKQDHPKVTRTNKNDEDSKMQIFLKINGKAQVMMSRPRTKSATA